MELASLMAAKAPALLMAASLAPRSSKELTVSQQPRLSWTGGRLQAAGPSVHRRLQTVLAALLPWERLMVGIDLGKETAAEFTGRIRRIADTLDLLDDPVSDVDIAEIMSRGECTARLKELPSDTQVTLLKDLLNTLNLRP